MNSKTLLLTFDYELFLGKNSGTASECMLKPTSLILEILDKYNIKGAVFFVDVTYLQRLNAIKEKFPKALVDFNNITTQIINIVKQGHYAFPHIHSHWIDAIYDEENNVWDLSKIDNYRFHNVKEELRVTLFDDCISLFKKIILSKFPDYKIDSFRAGGLSIQPFSAFKPLFNKHGIENDFSVLPNLYEVGSVLARHFDFRNASHLNYYKFSEDINEVDYKGNFNEFTISTLELNYFEKFLSKFLLKINHLILRDFSFGKGTGAEFSETVEKSKTNLETVSIEWGNFYKARKYKRSLLKTNYLHMLSHPKMITPKNIKVFDRFLKSIAKEKLNFDFRKIKSDKPNIIICSYTLPPEPGIGGRRWAKFAKYFKKHGFNVSLLSADLSESEIISPWQSDVENINITRLPRKYPEILNQAPKNIISKLKFFITKYLFQIKVKGTIYDRSVNWEKQFKNFFDRTIVQKNIYAVVSTGAPFNLMYLTAKLKNKYPQLKVINDFRDPWTWGEIYGFKNIEPSRLALENFKEHETIRLSDFITSSAKFIYEALEKKYPQYSDKFRLIPHGFDKDDFYMKKSNLPADNNKVKIIYGGTLYENLQYEMEFILKLAAAYPDNIEIDFYTLNNQYDKLFSSHNLKNVRIYKQINAKEFFKIIGNYQYYLCITNERQKDNISTKYYEIFANNKPILYYGPKGYITKMVLDNNVGMIIDDKKSIEELYKQIVANINTNWDFNKIGLEKFDFENLSRDFEKLILE